MLIFLNYPTNSDFIPEWTLPIFKTNYSDSNKFIEIILNKEQSILDLSKDDYSKYGTMKPGETLNNWVSASIPHYNFFESDDEEIIGLKNFIKKSYVDMVTGMKLPDEEVYIHGWINIVRKGRKIEAHNHTNGHLESKTYSSAYLSGNLCINAENTTTNYRSPYLEQMWQRIPNVNGDMVLFPSFVMHDTSINNSETPRLSIAFDILPERVYMMLNNKNIFCKL